MDKEIQLLKVKALEYGIELDDTQLEQFEAYWNILFEYNKHTNLVSSADKEIVYKRHFIDSLSIGLFQNELKWGNAPSVIDIGIGGGFPGVPILIANKQAKLYAVESIAKKINFLDLLTKKLGIDDRVTLVNKRAEDICETKKQTFDIAVMRAVAQLNVICEYGLPFVKKGGHFVAYKAKSAQEEIKASQKALSALGGVVIGTKSYAISKEEDIERNLILIKKDRNTPKQYPRKTGIPKKKPLE